jgi:hypothetical protein
MSNQGRCPRRDRHRWQGPTLPPGCVMLVRYVSWTPRSTARRSRSRGELLLTRLRELPPHPMTQEPDCRRSTLKD